MTRKVDRGDLSPHAAAIERWDTPNLPNKKWARQFENTGVPCRRTVMSREAQERVDET